jgi:prepilin-type N-terminal cleavage/methylation domain-containing protein
MAKRSSSRAFSLLELTVVITLLAILAAAVAPRLTSGYASAEDRAHVRRLISLVRSARENAVMTGETTAIRIDAEGTVRSVLVGEDNSERLLSTLPASGEWRADIGTSVAASIEFFADGSSSGAAIEFARVNGSESRELFVEAATGSVEWRERDENREPTTWAAGEFERRG